MRSCARFPGIVQRVVGERQHHGDTNLNLTELEQRTVTGEKEPRRVRVPVISMCVYRLVKETDLQELETVGDADGRNEGRHQVLGCSSFVIVKTETDFVEASYLDSRSRCNCKISSDC